MIANFHAPRVQIETIRIAGQKSNSSHWFISHSSFRPPSSRAFHPPKPHPPRAPIRCHFSFVVISTPRKSCPNKTLATTCIPSPLTPGAPQFVVISHSLSLSQLAIVTEDQPSSHRPSSRRPVGSRTTAGRARSWRPKTALGHNPQHPLAAGQVGVDGDMRAGEIAPRECGRGLALTMPDFQQERGFRLHVRRRLGQKPLDDAQPVRPAVQGRARLIVPHLGHQAGQVGRGDVRQIGRDEVESPVHGLQQIALHKTDARRRDVVAR